MEQSRVATTATRLYRVLCLARQNQQRFAAVSTGRPAVFSEELNPGFPTGETKDKYEPETAKRDVEETETEYSKGTAVPRPPHASSPRLESIGVNNPVEPYLQQKLENSISSSILEETSCAGLDGTPWPKEEKERDENEYYRHHKASPLSEIEIADTRKPITRATDGKGTDVITWLPEQLDTAEEALARAHRIWRENAMRGDPDSPHGRVLRALRGESF